MSRPRISTDECNFFVDLRGDGWSVFFAFDKDELAKGASLARMMTEKVRVTIQHGGNVISSEELKTVARAALPLLRTEVDGHFASKR